MKTPYTLTLTFNTFAYGLNNGLLDEFLSFVLAFVGEGWSVQHTAWYFGTKWPKGYVRHTRMAGSASYTIFSIRNSETKEKGWELRINASWKCGPIAKIEVQASHEDAIKALRTFAEEIRGNSLKWISRSNPWSELGKKLSIEESMSGDHGE